MCDKVISKEPFVLNIALIDKKKPKTCEKAIYSYLLALIFVPGWFVTSKLIEKLGNAVFSNDEIVFGDVDSDIVTFFSNNIGLNSLNLNNNNLDDDNFDDCDPKTINHVKLMAKYNRYK